MLGGIDDERFALARGGRFMEREGPRGRLAGASRLKVCIAATDPALLADLLYRVSLREDCDRVKYSRFARDGMVLGRVWLETDRAAAELCEALKGNPRLLVSLQDDGFFDAFRAPPVETGQYGIWDEFVDDADDVAEVHRTAFGRDDEAAMVAAVRASRVPVISLVAATRQGAAVITVGHVLLSPVAIEGSREPPGVGLAPLAVVPEHQRRGIGGRLVLAALERARLLGYRYAVVLGDPAYYGRFGFRAASSRGLRYSRPVPPEAFMALELSPGALAGARGVVSYQPAFEASGHG